MIEILPEDKYFKEIVEQSWLDLFTEDTLFELKLIDLGLCKQTLHTVISSEERGKVNFMSPEAASKKYSEKSDVYSIGVLMIDMNC